MARKVNRSGAGNFVGILFLVVIAAFMVLPMIYAVGNSFKPMDELFRFPPTLLPQRWVTTNYTDLFVLMGNSWVPFSRYFFNTLFITAVGTFGQIVFCSMCAFPLALYRFPGSKFFSTLITTALMFNGTVLWLPLFMIKANLGMIDTYWAIIVPTFGAPMGMYLMRQFMTQIPRSLVEAARIDGASSLRIFWSIV
ncbi:MAG: carbohydrate ABC transporter permease, partial [Clostridia bacterium]|nr:carbohydrate ABC transporter permease [Clostridia bacterium]